MEAILIGTLAGAGYLLNKNNVFKKRRNEEGDVSIIKNFQSKSIGEENRSLSGGKKGPRSVGLHGMQIKEKNIHIQGLPLSQIIGIKISFTSSS